MASFDATLWQERALKRLERSSEKSTQRRTRAKEQYDRDLRAISALTKLIDWCHERTITVDFKKTFAATLDPEKCSIVISGRASPEIQVGWLIHECGHWLIDNCGDKRIRCGVSGSEDERSLIARVDVVHEEFEAWHRGEKLAKRLRVPYNKARFEKQRADALNSYFKWAGRY